jgi:hypothetical protein
MHNVHMQMSTRLREYMSNVRCAPVVLSSCRHELYSQTCTRFVHMNMRMHISLRMHIGTVITTACMRVCGCVGGCVRGCVCGCVCICECATAHAPRCMRARMRLHLRARGSACCANRIHETSYRAHITCPCRTCETRACQRTPLTTGTKKLMRVSAGAHVGTSRTHFDMCVGCTNASALSSYTHLLTQAP